MRVNERSVELLSDAYSLPTLRPEIEISGNIEQNALNYIFSQEPNKTHILYQPQHWYNCFKGHERAETEINEGDMLVHLQESTMTTREKKKPANEPVVCGYRATPGKVAGPPRGNKVPKGDCRFLQDV